MSIHDKTPQGSVYLRIDKSIPVIHEFLWDDPLPGIFPEKSDVCKASIDIVGRNRLVLKARNSTELMYYTTDDE